MGFLNIWCQNSGLLGHRLTEFIQVNIDVTQVRFQSNQFIFRVRIYILSVWHLIDNRLMHLISSAGILPILLGTKVDLISPALNLSKQSDGHGFIMWSPIE